MRIVGRHQTEGEIAPSLAALMSQLHLIHLSTTLPFFQWLNAKSGAHEAPRKLPAAGLSKRDRCGAPLSALDSGARRPLVRRARGRHDPRVRVHPDAPSRADRGAPASGRRAEYLRRKQLPGGGWANYPGGPAEVSASVKAYFVLKLAGDDPTRRTW